MTITIEELEKLHQEMDSFLDESGLLDKFNLTKDEFVNMSDNQFDSHVNRVKLLKDRKEKLNKLKNKERE